MKQMSNKRLSQENPRAERLTLKTLEQYSLTLRPLIIQVTF